MKKTFQLDTMVDFDCSLITVHCETSKLEKEKQ